MKTKRSIKNFIVVPALLFLVAGLVCSCASQKAVVDRAAMGKIFWPGQPERPRVSYLWTITTAPAGGEEIAGVIAGEEGGPSRLSRPYSIFLDDAGNLFITDPGAGRVMVIDQESGDAESIQKAGDDVFQSPIGIVTHKGSVFVSDSLLSKVFVLDRGGKKLDELAGEFARPTSLALDRDRGLLYVADTLAHMVHVYSVDGRRLRTIGRNGEEKGEFNFPTHLWVDRKGRLYVTDSLNFRIQIFSPDGTFEEMFGMLGDAYGNLDKPKGVAADSDGNIYVVDSIKDTVKIFNRKGELLLFFGVQGRGYGEFWLPSGIFIDGQDKIYVADTYNGRIQVFQYLKDTKR